VDLLQHPCTAMKRLKSAFVVATLRQKRHWGDSIVGHRSKKCDRIGGAIRLTNDYFVERSLFNSEEFRRRCNVNANSVLL
jgi:hypothetical protein